MILHGPSLPALLFTISLFQACGRPAGNTERPPNVLFIAVDDLNDWTGVLEGHRQARTPHLDRLAGEGILFTNAHSNCAACQPSRNSVLSGLMPHSTGWYANTFGRGWKRPVYEFIRERSVSLPAYFRKHGYFTMGAGKLYHSGVAEYDEDVEEMWDETAPPYEISSYFMDTVGHGYGAPMYHPFPKGGSPFIQEHGQKIPGFSLCGGPLDRAEDVPGGIMHDEFVAEWASEKLGNTYGRPFLLAVGFVRPHVPFTAPETYFEMYEDLEIVVPEVPPADLRDIPLYGKAMIPGILPGGDHRAVLGMGPEYWPDLVKAYLACVTFVDAQIGRVVDALDSGPHASNTIVVLWSDHGQHLGEKKHWRKMALWEESTRVPLVFRLPGGTSGGKRSGRPVGLIDLYPTLVELCGIPGNDALEGRSLVPLLYDPGRTWDYPVVQSWMHGNFAVRSEHFRYIRYRDGSEELYDHRRDPGEWENLAGEPAFAQVIEAHRARIPDSTAHPFQQDSTPDDELDRRVRAWKTGGLPNWLH